jgi:hypothetical protein
VIGTPSWTTTATLDGVAVIRPTVTSPKLPAPMSTPTSTVRPNGRGIGRSHGQTEMSTTASRTAEKNSGGICDRPPMSGPGSMLVQGWSGRHG